MGLIENVEIDEFFKDVQTSEIDELDKTFQEAFGKGRYVYQAWIIENRLLYISLKDKLYGASICHIPDHGWMISYNSKNSNMPLYNEDSVAEYKFLNKRINEINRKYYPLPKDIEEKFLKLKGFFKDNISETDPMTKEIYIDEYEPVIQIYTTLGENAFEHIEVGFSKLMGGWYIFPGGRYDEYSESLKDGYEKLEDFVRELNVSIDEQP